MSCCNPHSASCSVKRQVDILELRDLEKEYILSRSRLTLAQHHPPSAAIAGMLMPTGWVTHGAAEKAADHVTLCRRSLCSRITGLTGSDGTLRLSSDSESDLQPELDARF